MKLKRSLSNSEDLKDIPRSLGNFKKHKELKKAEGILNKLFFFEQKDREEQK